MREVTLEELLEAGCHFGHQVTRQNPKARDYIFEARDNIHIIDLTKTKEDLEAAAAFIKDLASKEGSTILLVGTKRQAQAIVNEEVKKVQQENAGGPARQQTEPQAMAGGFFYISNRWVGGLLTNFTEVAKNYKKLNDLSAKLKDPEEKAKYTKKEIGLWEKERAKLESFYGGVAEMKKVPDALFIIDTHLEELAVREARAMGVTTVGITDTNADPHLIDYPIPANDDAVGSIKLITSYIVDAWIEGRKEVKKEKPATTEVTEKKYEALKEKPATTESTERKNENADLNSVKTAKKQRKTVVARKTKRVSK